MIGLSYVYLSPEDAQKVLVQAWGNPPGNDLPLAPAPTQPVNCAQRIDDHHRE
jgi:hypothetical protein